MWQGLCQAARSRPRGAWLHQPMADDCLNGVALSLLELEEPARGVGEPAHVESQPRGMRADAAATAIQYWWRDATLSVTARRMIERQEAVR